MFGPAGANAKITPAGTSKSSSLPLQPHLWRLLRADHRITVRLQSSLRTLSPMSLIISALDRRSTGLCALLICMMCKMQKWHRDHSCIKVPRKPLRIGRSCFWSCQWCHSLTRCHSTIELQSRIKQPAARPILRHKRAESVDHG